MANPVVYWELASNDSEKSVEFFKNVFDWDFIHDDKIGIYETAAKPNDLAGGGIFTLRKAKLPFLTVYVKVKDIKSMAKKITDNGGHIVEEPFEVVPGTWICLFNEPSGVTFSMIEKLS